jgi:hypothetical protein
MGRTEDQSFDELKGPRVLVKFERETNRKGGVSSTGNLKKQFGSYQYARAVNSR